MIASGDQNQFSSSFAPFGDLLKTLMFLSNLNGFNSSPSPSDQGFARRKGSCKVWKEKGSKWFCHFFSLPFMFLFCTTCVLCFLVLSQSSFMHCFFLLNMFLFVYFSVLPYFAFIKKKNWKIRKIQKQCVFVYIGTCVPWLAIEIKIFKLCIFCNLNEHLYAQLSKWVLWLMFMMSKVKWFLELNTRITLFDRKD